MPLSSIGCLHIAEKAYNAYFKSHFIPIFIKITLVPMQISNARKQINQDKRIEKEIVDLHIYSENILKKFSFSITMALLHVFLLSLSNMLVFFWHFLHIVIGNV